MALPSIFNIPNLPGVPPLTGYASSTVNILFADVVSLINIFGGNIWGVFFNGFPAFDINSILDFDFKQDWAVSDYPVEDGAFLSYDKVQQPFDIRVRLVSKSSEVERLVLLNQVLAAANSLNLYTVVTPEQVFANCNIAHVDYKRASHNGLGILIVDIWFVQIRVTATSLYSTTQSPTTAGSQNTGSSIASPPPSSVATGLAGGTTQVQ